MPKVQPADQSGLGMAFSHTPYRPHAARPCAARACCAVPEPHTGTPSAPASGEGGAAPIAPPRLTRQRCSGFGLLYVLPENGKDCPFFWVLLPVIWDGQHSFKGRFSCSF
jgi:hypothetical protein